MSSLFKTFFASKLTVEMETVACLFPPSKVWVITPHYPIILCITTQYRVSHRLREKYRWFLCDAYVVHRNFSS